MDIVERFRDGIMQDTDIPTFTNTNYGKDPLYVMGRDPRRPLGVDDSPYILVTPIGRLTGESVSQLAYTFEVEWAIRDRVFSDINTNGAKEMQGFYKLDEFGNLIKQALYNLSYSNIIADDIDYDLQERTIYPFFVGYMIVAVQIQDVLGGTIGLT